MKEIILDNIRFIKTKSGHYRSNLGLHQYVWIKNNGAIPKGYEIHHINGDKSDNSIKNLALLTRKEHRSIHMKQRCDDGSVNSKQQIEECRRRLNSVRHLASQWHKSKEGLAWHKKHAKGMKQYLYKRHTVICEYCGKRFETKSNRARFCCKCCKTKWYYHNRY